MSLRDLGEETDHVVNSVGHRAMVEECKQVLLAMDEDMRAKAIKLMLPAYQALAAHHLEMCAFLRALQVGASGSA